MHVEIGVGLTGQSTQRGPIVMGWPELPSSWPLRQSLHMSVAFDCIQLAASHQGARAIYSAYTCMRGVLKAQPSGLAA